MRNALAAGAILLSTSAILATPVHAQGGAFMWCQASAVKDGQTSHFYSAFFAAEAWQATRKALAFANELKKGDAAGALIASGEIVLVLTLAAIEPCWSTSICGTTAWSPICSAVAMPPPGPTTAAEITPGV